MTENRKPHMIVLRLAAVLLVLVMLSTSMVAGRYARYVTTATASDSARVAKYDISVASPSPNSLTMSQDASVEYNFTVTSNSEVSVEYDLIITLPTALPSGVTVTLTGNGKNIGLNPGTNECKNVGTFSPQGGTHTYTIIFAANEAIGSISPISIRVDTRQVD